MSAPAEPYVGLEHFREEDKDFFFGRDADRRKIIFNVKGSRLTLLCAESGVGKTSLLHAGVSARLKEIAAKNLDEAGSADYLPFVFSGWRQGSTEALIAELETQSRAMLADGAELTLPRESLDAALARIGEQTGAVPLLILDGFEDVLFEPDDDHSFDEQLVRCVTAQDLRANFLLSVRQDAMSLIGQRFKGLIPNVYGNFLYLDFLDEAAAQDAVVGPITAFNRLLPEDAAHHEIESALVEQVLKQVRRGRIAVGEDAGAERQATSSHGVETAYLQLVMQRLWEEELEAGSRVLRLRTLERLGGADRIVHAHLDDVMDSLPPDQADAAAAAFRFLLTSGGRKIALSTQELREFSEADEAALEPALAHLERERILRPVPAPEPERRREIFHDVLAPAVHEWRRRHDEERRVRERTRRLEVRVRRLAVTAIVLSALVAGLALHIASPDALRRLELATVDARFALRGERSPDPRVVLVAVDGRTLRALAGPDETALPRSQHARLLRRVMREGPAVVAIDVIFEGAKGPRGDAALLAAMRDAGDRLVLPYDPVTARAVTLPDGNQAMRPVLLGRPELPNSVRTRFGYAGLPRDVDGRIRRVDYEVPFFSQGVDQRIAAPTLAFVAADVTRGGALRANLDDLPAAARRAVGGQSEATTWIDTHWPAGTVPQVSALDVLRDDVPPSVLRGRSVVIGVVPDAPVDFHGVPHVDAPGVPGAELHAEAIATMLRGSPLREPSRAIQVVEVLTIVLFGVLPALAIVARRRRLALAAVPVAAIVYLVAAHLAFEEGRVLVVVPPLIALAVCALGIGAIHFVRAWRAGSTRSRPG